VLLSLTYIHLYVSLHRLESSVGLGGSTAHGQSVHGHSSGPTGGFGAKGQPALAKNKSIREEFCCIQLNETATRMSFSMPSLVVASDTREVILTDERNAVSPPSTYHGTIETAHSPLLL
jgi:ribosomal protein L15